MFVGKLASDESNYPDNKNPEKFVLDEPPDPRFKVYRVVAALGAIDSGRTHGGKSLIFRCKSVAEVNQDGNV